MDELDDIDWPSEDEVEAEAEREIVNQFEGWFKLVAKDYPEIEG